MSGFLQFSLEDGLCGQFCVFSAVGIFLVRVACFPCLRDCVRHLAQPFAVLRCLQDGFRLEELFPVSLWVSKRCDQPLTHQYWDVVFLAVEQPSRLRAGRSDRQLPEIQELKFLVAHKQILFHLFHREGKNEQTFSRNSFCKNWKKLPLATA